MEIEFKAKIRKPGVKKREGNSNQMELRLKKPVALDVLEVNVEEKIRKTCRSIKNLLGVEIIMSGQNMTGITITSCAGWDKEFVKEVKSKLTKVIEGKT